MAGATRTTIFIANAAQSQQQTAAASAESGAALKTALQINLKDPPLEDDKTTRYWDGWIDLNDDGRQECIVYITGLDWCGSGGCTTLILKPENESFTVITRMTITRAPIRVLTTKSNGWHNLTVLVAGGGINPGYEAELHFDGQSYPTNPSVPPAWPIDGNTPEGEILIPDSANDPRSGRPLYP